MLPQFSSSSLDGEAQAPRTQLSRAHSSPSSPQAMFQRNEIEPGGRPKQPRNWEDDDNFDDESSDEGKECSPFVPIRNRRAYQTSSTQPSSDQNQSSSWNPRAQTRSQFSSGRRSSTGDV
eukprot:c4380_g1_i1.p1 GENE.c4380_g1_i1~~c4380_g1_i1.p1  ORF type:complete len:120 (+),score=7.61 c4380_g1_i1:149-508(+)